MPIFLRILTIVGWVAFAQLSFSCSDDQSAEGVDYQMQMEAISQQIESLLNTACSDSDQCKAAAIGVKPCGGPTHFVIYSSVSGGEEALQPLISEYNQLNRAYNEANDIGSDCAIETPPNLGCTSGECSEI